MAVTHAHFLPDLELIGDGDEIDAIGDVELAFGIELDCTDADEWVTVGGVYDSLRAALREDQRAAPDLWPHFAKAIGFESGVDPDRIVPATKLLAPLRAGRYSRLILFSAVATGLAAIIYLLRH